MASKLSIQLLGEAELRRKLAGMTPNKNRRIFVKSLTEAAMAVARNAADKQIKRGGRVRVPGPRGGKGKLTSAAAVKGKLTSRTNRLRGSIAGRGFREGMDTRGLPRFIEVATNVKYAEVHENGGTYSVKQSSVKAHTRTKAFGKTFPAFKVPAHTRKAHSVTFPERPFLGPALQEVSKTFRTIFLKHWRREGAFR